MPASINRTTSARWWMPLSLTISLSDRNPFRQTQRDSQIGREGLEISVVDADQPRLRDPF